MRARRLDALRRRLEHLGRERLREAALHLRHARAHAVAGKPAAHEDDEAVQACDTVPAVGERVDLELDLLVLANRRGHPDQGTRQVMSRRRVRTTPAAPSDRDPAERDGHGGPVREEIVAAAAVGAVERLEGKVCDRNPSRSTSPNSPSSSVSPRKIQISVPTSAATWLCTTEPIDTPRRPHRTRQQDRLRGALPDFGVTEVQVGADNGEPDQRDAGHDHEREQCEQKAATRVSAMALAADHALPTRFREQRRRDRAVAELRRDDRDPEDDREQGRDPGGVDETELEVERAPVGVLR